MFAFDQPVPLPNNPLDLLTVGEMLVDFIADHEEASRSFSEVGYHPYFGGSPANIAMNTNRLGIQAQVAAALGNDAFGAFLTQKLAERGLDTGLLQQSAMATSLVVVNRSKASPVPMFYRRADRGLQWTPQLQETVSQTKILHFSCWPISALPARLAVEQAIETANSAGALIGFDPNYHPGLWEAEDDGPGFIRTLLPRVHVVKPSEDDAARIFGEASPEKQVERFLSLGVGLVMLTMGERGCMVSNGKETFTLDSLADTVQDTTGAGDAFWSGFYAAVVKGRPLKQAVMLGMAVSAYKLRYCGAVVPLPHLDAIEATFLRKDGCDA